MKNGVPLHLAFGAPADFEPDDRFLTALAISFGQMAGGEWDWGAMAWKERK